MNEDHFDFKPLSDHIEVVRKHFEANNKDIDTRDLRRATYDLHCWLNARTTSLTDLRIMYAVMHVINNRKKYDVG